MIFSHKNQTFKTTDLFFLVALVGVIGSIFGAILAETFQDNRSARARAMAEVWAEQIRAQQSHSLAGRSPASLSDSAPVFSEEGNVGQDPWGRPFHYLLKASGAPNHWLLSVWSDGPNGKPETETNGLGLTAKAGGDDIAFTDEFNSEP